MEETWKSGELVTWCHGSVVVIFITPLTSCSSLTDEAPKGGKIVNVSPVVVHLNQPRMIGPCLQLSTFSKRIQAAGLLRARMSCSDVWMSASTSSMPTVRDTVKVI